MEYRILWSNYTKAESTWVEASLCDCDEAIQEFEIEQLQSIVGMKKTRNGFSYGVKLRGEPKVVGITSDEAISKWPDQVYAYLEERIQFTMPDPSKVMPSLKEANDVLADGKPILAIGKLRFN